MEDIFLQCNIFKTGQKAILLTFLEFDSQTASEFRTPDSSFSSTMDFEVFEAF